MQFQNYLCFAETFVEGRQWLREAVAAAGGTLHTATNPHGLTPTGAPLSTDIGWFGAVDAANVFVSICGTHGAEYFSGAAGQLNWIATGGPAALPRDVAVCLVHAHNPYGAAWHSRGNENFVDLNRNYMDHATPLRPNPLYPELFDLLFTRTMGDHVLDEVMDRFYAFVERHDPVEAMTAMGGGQRTHPSGTLYCGSSREWSTTTLAAMATGLLDRAERIAVIDWHTGLGDFGKPTVLATLDPQSEEHRWAATWWQGAERNDELSSSAQPEFVGHVAAGLAGDIRRRGAMVVDTVVELGTFANRGVLQALLIDRWLRFECPDRLSPHAVALETRMVERLNPSNPEWRAAALDATTRIYTQTLAGLSAR